MRLKPDPRTIPLSSCPSCRAFSVSDRSPRGSILSDFLDYASPFSFEYLQTQARYLAEQASRIDQAYINFKSTAENEEFRREQMDQQAALASATVELQQRNLDEANSGFAVAQATLGYATEQQKQADGTLSTFLSTFNDLIDIAQAQAALGAVSLPAFQGRPASDAAAELAGTQGMLSSEMEGQRLLAEFLAAGKYIEVAQAQLGGEEEASRGRAAKPGDRKAAATLRHRKPRLPRPEGIQCGSMV